MFLFLLLTIESAVDVFDQLTMFLFLQQSKSAVDVFDQPTMFLF